MTDNILHELSMRIVKASFDKEAGVGRFRMVCSDTGPDVFDERMSLELFNDFTRRIEQGEAVPPPFHVILSEKSGWGGGMPYVSIAHYKSGMEGKNIPADVEKVYVDGDMLKATAVCKDSDLGRAVFKALKDDLEGKSDYDDKIRVSIGFLDLQHKHGNFVFTRDTLDKSCPMCENGDGDKVYLKGQLVHLALTRSPANPRTDTEVDMGKQITTKREDAESIVGESLAQEIEVNKTSLDNEPDFLVVKAEQMEDEEKEHPSDCTCKACTDKKKETMKSEVVEESQAVITEEKSALDTALEEFKSKVIAMKSFTRDEALQKLQPDFELLAKSVQDEFAETPAPKQVVASIDPALADLISSLKTSIDAIADKVGNLSTDVTILKSQGAVVNHSTKQNEVPQPRNAQIERSIPDMFSAQKPLSIRELAQRSVYEQK